MAAAKLVYTNIDKILVVVLLYFRSRKDFDLKFFLSSVQVYVYLHQIQISCSKLDFLLFIFDLKDQIFTLSKKKKLWFFGHENIEIYFF